MSTSARLTLTAAMSMLFVPILMDLTLVLAKLDFQGMAKVAMVSSCQLRIIMIMTMMMMMMMMMIIIIMITIKITITMTMSMTIMIMIIIIMI